jgi:predicted TPR repeat methyltransferase
MAFELTRWLAPFSVILVFFFGFAEEAKKQDVAAIRALLKHLGVDPPSGSTSSTSSTLKSQAATNASFASSSKYVVSLLHAYHQYTDPFLKAFASLQDIRRLGCCSVHSSCSSFLS